MIWSFVKRLPLLLLLGLTALIMANCTMLGLNYASLETANKAAPIPAIDPARFDRNKVAELIQDDLYGPWPSNLRVSVGEWQMVDESYLNGRATLQEVPITIGSGAGARTFSVVVALPAKSAVPVPLLLSQTFANNCSVFPGMAISDGNGAACGDSEMTGVAGFLATQIFGTYIAEAPVARYIDAGLGYASFHGSDFVPDSRSAGPSVMANLGEAPLPTGTVAAWAYAYEAVAESLKADPRVRSDAVAALGHSRFGKAALVAAAFGDAVDSAVAHQSGFAGAALSRSLAGERLDRMAESYPHWLKPGLAEALDAGTYPTLDQHYLLAMIAPKPVFLGNGRRDVWSDPNSTYRAAEAASALYAAKDAGGSLGEGMRDFDPSDAIAYWLRAGGHSVVSEDIDAFIAFMVAHFGEDAAMDISSQTVN